MLYSLTSVNLTLEISLGMIAGYLFLLIVIAETINRQQGENPELTRKIVHIGAGNVILLAWWLDIPVWLVILAAIAASFIALISLFIAILPSINSVGRRSLGTFFYAVSIGVLAAWFGSINHWEYAVIGILTMTWGDGLAAIVGKNFGRHPYQLWGMQKSWEGSLTMLLVSFCITSLILNLVWNNWLLWPISLAVAILATLLEAFSQWGIDNLTVPLGSAAFCFFLTRIY